MDQGSRKAPKATELDCSCVKRQAALYVYVLADCAARCPMLGHR